MAITNRPAALPRSRDGRPSPPRLGNRRPCVSRESGSDQRSLPQRRGRSGHGRRLRRKRRDIPRHLEPGQALSAEPWPPHRRQLSLPRHRHQDGLLLGQDPLAVDHPDGHHHPPPDALRQLGRARQHLERLVATLHVAPRRADHEPARPIPAMAGGAELDGRGQPRALRRDGDLPAAEPRAGSD